MRTGALKEGDPFGQASKATAGMEASAAAFLHGGNHLTPEVVEAVQLVRCSSQPAAALRMPAADADTLISTRAVVAALLPWCKTTALTDAHIRPMHAALDYAGDSGCRFLPAHAT